MDCPELGALAIMEVLTLPSLSYGSRLVSAEYSTGLGSVERLIERQESCHLGAN